MVFGRYKSTYTFLCVDDKTKKWSAWDLEGHRHSIDYDTVDQLRDALRLGTIKWKPVHTYLKEEV